MVLAIGANHYSIKIMLLYVGLTNRNSLYGFRSCDGANFLFSLGALSNMWGAYERILKLLGEG